MAVSHKWAPIEDLPADPASLTDGELISLKRIWDRQKKELAEDGTLDEFERRLAREWSIETGIIENVYTLDRGVTKTLIEKGIDAALIPHGTSNRDSTLVARIIEDHYDALEGMFDFVGGQRPLSTSYVKELHAALLRNQETHTAVDQFGRAFERKLEKGAYKDRPNSPTQPDGMVHEYCPPEHVAAEMDRLIAMYSAHENVPPEVEAAWLHHRFTQIHPFADGNGRVARALASLVFIKAGWFPLVVKRDDWERYIEALEQADQTDPVPLVRLFVEAQRTSVVQAAEIGYEVRPVSSAAEAIAAARDRLVQRGRVPPKEWLNAKDVARQLVRIGENEFQNVANQLSAEIASAGGTFGFGASRSTGQDENRVKALQLAGHLPNYSEFDTCLQLALITGRSERLWISFHAIGPRFRGFVCLVAYLTMDGTDLILIQDGTFQINYEEDPASAEARFKPWLERVIVNGLDAWRRTL